jgi:hypothetical protein
LPASVCTFCSVVETFSHSGRGPRRDTFTPVAGGFGKKGWTTARLDRLPEDELASALLTAWQHARLRRAPKD